MITTPIYGFHAPDDGEPFDQGAASMRDQVRQVEAVLALLTPTGMIVPFAGGTLPVSGWLLCDGLPHDKTAHKALWDVIEYTYGGSGDTFNTPNLLGKVIAGMDSSQTEFASLGHPFGAKVVVDTNLPVHSHTMGHNHGFDVGGGGHYHRVRDGSGSGAGSWSLDHNPNKKTTNGDAIKHDTGKHRHKGNTGGSSEADTGDNGVGTTSHNNIQPTVSLNYIIKT